MASEAGDALLRRPVAADAMPSASPWAGSGG